MNERVEIHGTTMLTHTHRSLSSMVMPDGSDAIDLVPRVREYRTCSRCRGSGNRMRETPMIAPLIAMAVSACPDCGGSGRTEA